MERLRRTLAEERQQRKEALAYQAATAEILSAISKSAADARPVFDAIVRNLRRLLGTRFAVVQLVRGAQIELVGFSGGAGFEKVAEAYPQPLDAESVTGKAMLSRNVVQMAPIAGNPKAPPRSEKLARRLGYNAILGAPMVHEGKVIGAIATAHRDAVPFSDSQIALIKAFADQAVIAIDNVRLFKETKEALERQTATAEILRVISSTTTDTQPVFEAIVESGLRVLPDTTLAIAVVKEDAVRVVATGGYLRGALGLTVPPGRESATGTAIADRRLVHLPDVEAPDVPSLARENGRRLGYRSMAVVPMLREDRVIGAISVLLKTTGGLSDKQLNLLKTFADQAVIAIENVRLFNETKEALERQTATSDVLAAISGAQTDVGPVFEAIARNGQRLCGAVVCNVLRYDGEMLHVAASHGFSPEQETKLREKYPVKAGDASVLSGRVIVSRRIEHIEDVESDPAYDHAHAATVAGWRRMLGVPMLRDDVPLGVIVVAWRDPGKTPEGEVELLKTFAAQAAIAIENVRLFNETREALERQTATADILRVIGSSMTDAQPVFDTIVKNCRDLFGGSRVGLWLIRERQLFCCASTEYGGESMPLDRESGIGACALEGRTIHFPDLHVAAEQYPRVRQLGLKWGFRSGLYAPLLREGGAIGGISVLRRETGAFRDKDVALLSTFANQAVIAIENMRLFNETKEALERQTATSEILKVIARSPTNVQPVLDTVAENAGRLCGAPQVTVLLKEGDLLRTRATYSSDSGPTPPSTHAFPVRRTYVTGRALLEARTVHLEDVSTILDSEFPDARGNQETYGFRGVLAVPMIRNGEGIGVLYAWRREPGLFAAEQVALLQTFADQAVIAIQNAQLFREIQERNTELKEALEQQTATSDILKVISRTTFDLQPVLEIVLSNARKLCQADRGIIFRPDDRGHYFPMAFAAPEDERQNRFREIFNREPIKVDRSSATGRAIVDGVTVHIPDVLTDPEYKRSDIANAGNYRSILAVPMLRAGTPIGVLALSRVGEAKPFNEKQIELVTVFADQAVIAIENVRLFNEIQEKSGQLEVANAQLEVANKHKSEFLASMSHELRTPLNAILGFNEMILGQIYGEVPVDMKEPLEDIQKSGKHLLRLINNVLDLAKIEAGRMELVLSDYSVHDTVESVRSTLRPLAVEKGLEFVARVPADIPLAYGDQGRLTQCLMNLAGNALKFTKVGKVEISVEGRAGVLIYRVSDTGMGIPQDKLTTLFSEFRQTDATIASEYGGTGLGLSISRKFIEMHGGRIWVESELGKGSTFIFEVPGRVAQVAAA